MGPVVMVVFSIGIANENQSNIPQITKDTIAYKEEIYQWKHQVEYYKAIRPTVVISLSMN